ncbi:MAG: DNA helicase UvrA, partial [Firmicutes bacterium]|nr:DNA helicase UvrA [Bacillota bacterium]
METRQLIKLRKACANNLTNVDLDLPKQRITVFTGVSGSGKSSLVFDTIGAEARRQISELFSAFAL